MNNFKSISWSTICWSLILGLLKCFILQNNLFQMQPSENLYDQKPEEPVIPVSSTKSSPTAGLSLAKRFEYVDNFQSAENSSSGPHMISHVVPPKSSSFFADFGMDSGFPRKAGSNSSKVQVCFMISKICVIVGTFFYD